MKHTSQKFAKVHLPGRSPFWVEIISFIGTGSKFIGKIYDPTSRHYKQALEFDWEHVTGTASLKTGLSGLDSPYIPGAETCAVLDTIVPDSMDWETHIAVRKVRDDVGNLSEYVAGKLGMTLGELCNALAAEQIDAVAMAVHNIENRNQGIIIGDQTGIGKGRVAAAMIRYAHVQGMKPVFISEKPNLFTDIYRDLVDIGADGGVPMETVTETPTLKKIKFEPWEKLSEDEKTEYDNDPQKYEEYKADPDNQYEEVFRRTKNPAYDKYQGNRLRPFIINGRSFKTNILDKNGNLLYAGLQKQELDEILTSGRLPQKYDLVVATYSQFNNEKRPAKRNFLSNIAQGSILIMDEAHNASGTSNTGEFLTKVLERARGVVFLSATFAKRPDNMPIYAAKTAMRDANLSKDELVASILSGGVALQEVLSAQLVSEGQMLRRERSFEGVEVNYITLDGLETEHRAVSDSVTEILRDIIKFQKDNVKPIVKGIDKMLAREGKEIKERGGTSQAGIDNTPYFSKVFQVINQMLFSIKAESVALKAIERLKEGKKPVIAFASTMGAFLEQLENVSGDPVQPGDMINADFATVLQRGLDGVFRYSLKDHKGISTKGEFAISDLTEGGRERYFEISKKIRERTTGISVSPIDRIIDMIEKAGYSVAEITGRRLEIVFDSQKASHRKAAMPVKKSDHQDKKQAKGNDDEKPIRKGDIQKHFPLVYKFMPAFQQQAIEGSEEHWKILYRIEATLKDLAQHNGDKIAAGLSKKYNWVMGMDYALIYAHFFYGGSDWWVYGWDGKDDIAYAFVCLNGDWQMAEYGSISLHELAENRVELDFFFTPKTLLEAKNRADAAENPINEKDKEHISIANEFYRSEYLKNYQEATKGGFSGIDDKTPASKLTGVVFSRPRLNVAEAFRKFNNNEVDVLMINQSGSTGASAHAIVTDKVPAEKVKQRVMLILQPELNINTEVQKRGRINRTGQVLKPIYDYVNSAIPAERRIMMMLKKKLKSLDANTTSNQRQSEQVLSSDDFLNKYGDEVVFNYLDENPELNMMLGDLLRKEQSEDGKASNDARDNIALRASGRVAVLSCDEQEKFYTEVIERYDQYVKKLKAMGRYDLEVETLALDAETVSANIVIAGKGGHSVFAGDTLLEMCRINNLRKPFTHEELNALVQQALSGRSADELREEMIENYRQFMLGYFKDQAERVNKRAERLITEITDEKKYKALETETDRKSYIEKRREEIEIERKLKEDQARSDAEARFSYMNKFFSYFKIGHGYNYPDNNVDIHAVFVGYTMNMSKQNPWAPSGVGLKFAIANSIKYLELVCSGEDGQTLLAIIGASGTIPGYLSQSILRDWDRLCSKASSTRKVSYIVTGNILQAFSKYSGHLISYTTLDGSTKKGILMPDSFDPEKVDRKGGGLVTMPVIRCREIILEQLSPYYNNKIESTTGLIILRNYGDNFSIIVPSSGKAGGMYYKDPVLISLSKNPDDGFQKSGNKMVASYSRDNMDRAIEHLWKEHQVNMKVDAAKFSLDVSVDVSNQSSSKDERTQRAEAAYRSDKQHFQCRRDPPSCEPLIPAGNDDKERKHRRAMAMIKIKAAAIRIRQKNQ
jgi:hypothetical protein